LELAHFKVVRTTCLTDERGLACFVFLLQSVRIPCITERIGPEVFRKKESFEFISKNSKDYLLFWANKEMRLVGLFKTRITNAEDYLRLLLNKRSESAGITRGLKEDLESTTLKIYTGREKGMIRGIVRDAVNQVVTTEQYILRF
jgi:tRNA nucleotidyltransferase (CCA-adding enzyme)